MFKPHLKDARMLEEIAKSRQGRPAATTPDALLYVQAINHSRQQRNSEGKFPKPPGEPGRPRSGGYALEVALKDCGWETENIKAFIVRVLFYIFLRMLLLI